MNGGDGVLDPGEVTGGLFLIVPPAPPPDLAARLDPLLAAGGTVGLLVQSDLPDRTRALAELCARRRVALFVSDPGGVGETGATGALLDDPAAIGPARRRFGEAIVLGIASGLSRHAAMTGGEEGADLVAFGDPDRAPDEPLLDMLRWWSGLFVLPALALARIAGPEDALLLREAGADFVAVPVGLLTGDDHPDELMGRLIAAVGAA